MKTDNNDRQLIRDLYILFLAFYNRGKNSNDIFFLIVELENIYGEKNYLDNIDDIKSVREEVVGEEEMRDRFPANVEGSEEFNQANNEL